MLYPDMGTQTESTEEAYDATATTERAIKTAAYSKAVSLVTEGRVLLYKKTQYQNLVPSKYCNDADLYMKYFNKYFERLLATKSQRDLIVRLAKKNARSLVNQSSRNNPVPPKDLQSKARNIVNNMLEKNPEKTQRYIALYVDSYVAEFKAALERKRERKAHALATLPKDTLVAQPKESAHIFEVVLTSADFMPQKCPVLVPMFSQHKQLQDANHIGPSPSQDQSSMKNDGVRPLL